MSAFALLLSLVLMGMQASGDYSYLSPEELAKQSDLIVTGEFLGSNAIQPSNAASPLQLGTIRVESVLKGQSGLSVVYLNLPTPRPNGLVGSADILLKPGQKGLWYLKRKSEGLYVIDHPSRFVDMAAAGPRIQALKSAR